jgi:glycosyltransferase involved in cell wall biosynthesis
MFLVSVCIPCHNADRYVASALESVLTQSYQRIEIIVVNDGSTDRSGEVLRQFTDRGVVVIDEKCGSASRSRNRALRESKGELIKFFDADDIMHPSMIKKQVERLSGSGSDVAVSDWGRFYNDDLSTYNPSPQSVWRDMDARDWLIESWMDARPMMQPGQFLIPKELINICGGWNEDLTLIDDFEFFARVLCHARNVLFTPEATLYYRSGIGGSLSKLQSDSGLESSFRSIEAGTGHLLRCVQHRRAKLACANVMQDYIYTFYPRMPTLRKAFETRITELGGSGLRPTGTPLFMVLKRFFGWKLAMKIKLFLTTLSLQRVR